MLSEATNTLLTTAFAHLESAKGASAAAKTASDTANASAALALKAVAAELEYAVPNAPAPVAAPA